MSETLALLQEVRDCRHCEAHLPEGPRPVLQLSAKARILVAGQAPGRKVHQTGVPFDDASGERLRAWMGVDREVFYNPDQVAILPMAFCYPGKGKSGDLPPRPECTPLWRQRCLEQLESLELQLLIGGYAQQWHLPDLGKETLTSIVRRWRDFGEGVFPMPHPSPRNNIWLKKNPWFEAELVPVLQARVQAALNR